LLILAGEIVFADGAADVLEIGERDLPEFPLGPAIRCHRQSL
jgi:hypothetical protein